MKLPTEFQIFGFNAIKYNIDQATLRKKYHQLQMAHHPDRSRGADGTPLAAQIPNAYRVLSDPLKRALLIFEAYNQKVPEPTHNQLQSWMSLFELLQSNPEALTVLQQRYSRLLLDLQTVFSEWENGKAQLLACAELYLEIFYLARILHSTESE